MIPAAVLHSLIEAAALAPSKHNSQPWKFALDPDGVRIFPDLGRRLRAVDPEDRELFLSLGGAAENLMVAARHVGLQPALEIFPPDQVDDCLRITLRRREEHGDPLFPGLEARATNRNLYDGRPLTGAELALVRSVRLEDGVLLRIFTGGPEMEAISRLVQSADALQFRDPEFMEELARWLRFSGREVDHRHDGVPAAFLGLHGHVPHWLGEAGLRVDARAAKRASMDAERIASSGALAVVATVAEDREAWVKAGRSLERLSLTLALHEVAHAHLDQPCEVTELRGLLRETAQLGSAFPQAVLRLGHAEAAPHTRRRPLSEVLVSGH